MQLGIIGYPLGHTLSPIIHQRLLSEFKLEGRYDVMEIPPAHLAEDLKKLESWQGFNVTIPHKVAIMPLLDALNPAAQSTGAVNTVIRQDKRWVGDNTDVTGFLNSLSSLPTRPLVIGAGGAALAVINALHNHPLTLACRNPDKAPEDIKTIALADLHDLSRFDWVINTTPVGMSGHPIQDSPLNTGQLETLPNNALVYDLIYRPLETQLLKDAANRGLQTQNGLLMLIHQACAAFTLWTGKVVPDTLIPELEMLLITTLK